MSVKKLRPNASKVAEAVLEKYRELKKSSKPGIKSNGVKEWTVLAGLVAFDNLSGSIRPIVISTGVKATPDCDLDRSTGKMLHDCHAEILALRGLNTVLLREMKNIQDGQLCDYLKYDSDRKYFEWVENYELTLFISRLPCGDVSMDDMNSNEHFDDISDISNDNPIQYVDETVTTILRGRFNHKKSKIVRTKPGRFDSKITKSKSCTDKLCMNQYLSVLNCITYGLLKKPLFIKYLVIPNLQKLQLDKANDYFKARLSSLTISCQILELLTCEVKFIDDKKLETETPSPMSSIKLYFSDGKIIEQAILNGIRNGFFSKPSKPLKKNCETCISRYHQWKLYNELKNCNESYRSYLGFKNANTQRNHLKKVVRDLMSPSGWISTKVDDCTL